MRKFSILSLVLVCIALTAVNCSKEGPAGATGPAGPAGPQGPVGSPNVIFSAWFTPDQNGGWKDTSINGVAAQKKFNKPAAGVTLNVLNSGVILSYIKLNPDGAGGTTASIRPLPYANPGAANVFFPIHYVGSITYAIISSVNPGVAVAASSGALEFRYVIIPGGVAGGRMSGGPGAGYTVEQLQNMSYEQLSAVFHIPAEGASR